jgi:hypothetical protein
MLSSAEQYRPDFLTLPEAEGTGGLRWVGSTMMDSEQFHTEQWRVIDVAELNGQRVEYFGASIEGLRAYGRLVHQRREARKLAAIRRAEEDASWREAVEDARPAGYR